MIDHVGGGYGIMAWRHQLGEEAKIITGGDDGQFVYAVGADLGQTDGGGEGVADALAAECFLGSAAFVPIVVEWLSRAAVANGAVGFAIKTTHVAEIAEAGAGLIMSGVRKGVWELGDFERETGGRSDGVGENAGLSEAAEGDGLAFDFGLDAGLLAEGKGCSYLDAGGSKAENVTAAWRKAATAAATAPATTGAAATAAPAAEGGAK